MAPVKPKSGSKKASAKKKASSPSRAVATKKDKPAPRTSSSLEERMDAFLERFSSGLMPRMGMPAFGEMSWPFQANAPKVDVVERDDEILIRAELPGVNKDDLRLSLRDQTLTIRADTRKEEKEEKGNYFRREISTSTFQRTLTLPAAVEQDESKAKATFRDGVLQLKLKKVEDDSVRKIRVED